MAVNAEKALWLGSVQVTAEDISKVQADRSTNGQVQVHLILKPAIAAAVNGFISKSVGGQIEIWIGDELINTGHIAGAVVSENFNLVMTEAEAEQLTVLISSGSD